MNDEQRAEQDIAERIQVLSRAIRGAIHAAPDLVPPAVAMLDTMIDSLLAVMRERYDAAGSPYGNNDEGLWRWWNEMGR